MTPRRFGTLPSGETVEAYSLANSSGATLDVLTYGGIVTSLRMPDRRGRMGDVVLGYGDLEGYLRGRAYLGATVGRVAGRIPGGLLVVEGRTYPLACNEGTNHLHGGGVGLDRRIWAAEPSAADDGSASLRLSYRSPDGEEGYPGTADLAVTYTLSQSNALVVETEATVDRVTAISLTHHSYFNLAGEGSGDVLGHEFQINASRYAPAFDDFILRDRADPVAGTGSDLRSPRRLADALPALPQGHGDLYLVNPAPDEDVGAALLAARVSEAGTGRVLEVFTDESCLQFYTGAMLDGMEVGKSGSRYGPFAGFCLECQGHPNASPGVFGDILVHPGRPRRRRTVYAFSTN